jgi:hypothetical protein
MSIHNLINKHNLTQQQKMKISKQMIRIKVYLTFSGKIIQSLAHGSTHEPSSLILSSVELHGAA